MCDEWSGRRGWIISARTWTRSADTAMDAGGEMQTLSGSGQRQESMGFLERVISPALKVCSLRAEVCWRVVRGGGGVCISEGGQVGVHVCVVMSGSDEERGHHRWIDVDVYADDDADAGAEANADCAAADGSNERNGHALNAAEAVSRQVTPVESVFVERRRCLVCGCVRGRRGLCISEGGQVDVHAYVVMSGLDEERSHHRCIDVGVYADADADAGAKANADRRAADRSKNQWRHFERG